MASITGPRGPATSGIRRSSSLVTASAAEAIRPSRSTAAPDTGADMAGCGPPGVTAGAAASLAKTQRSLLCRRHALFRVLIFKSGRFLGALRFNLGCFLLNKLNQMVDHAVIFNFVVRHTRHIDHAGVLA